jgi:F-type H+-transporting ATPase subunit b
LELNWSTFLLEIINFLVLLWILKHFLYKPVLDVIARRRAGIETQLSEARAMREEAEQLKAEYEGRLAQWQQEQSDARTELAEEVDQERTRRLSSLQGEMEQARQKAAVAESKRRQDERREIEQRALDQAGQFAKRLLEQAASPELESRLIDITLEDLRRLTAEQVALLSAQWGPLPREIHVRSAFPLPEERRHELEQALQEVSGIGDAPVRYSEEPALMAGLRISIGAWVLYANLKDELKGLTRFAHGA